MKEQNDNQSNSLEGVGVFAGIRADNRDPKSKKDKVPNVPQNAEDKTTQVKESDKPDSTKKDNSATAAKGTNLDNNDPQEDSTKNTNIYGDHPGYC